MPSTFDLKKLDYQKLAADIPNCIEEELKKHSLSGTNIDAMSDKVNIGNLTTKRIKAMQFLSKTTKLLAASNGNAEYKGIILASAVYAVIASITAINSKLRETLITALGADAAHNKPNPGDLKKMCQSFDGFIQKMKYRQSDDPKVPKVVIDPPVFDVRLTEKYSAFMSRELLTCSAYIDAKASAKHEDDVAAKLREAQARKAAEAGHGGSWNPLKMLMGSSGAKKKKKDKAETAAAADDDAAADNASTTAAEANDNKSNAAGANSKHGGEKLPKVASKTDDAPPAAAAAKPVAKGRAWLPGPSMFGGSAPAAAAKAVSATQTATVPEGAKLT